MSSQAETTFYGAQMVSEDVGIFGQVNRLESLHDWSSTSVVKEVLERWTYELLEALSAVDGRF